MEKKLTEIARSYSQKLNIGNYQSVDFFCSQKMEVPIDEAEETSRALFAFCKHQVEYDMAQYIKINQPESEKVIDLDEVYKGYLNQPKIKSTWKDKKEENDFNKREAMMDTNYSLKKGE